MIGQIDRRKYLGRPEALCITNRSQQEAVEGGTCDSQDRRRGPRFRSKVIHLDTRPGPSVLDVCWVWPGGSSSMMYVCTFGTEIIGLGPMS